MIKVQHSVEFEGWFRGNRCLHISMVYFPSFIPEIYSEELAFSPLLFPSTPFSFPLFFSECMKRGVISSYQPSHFIPRPTFPSRKDK